MDSSEDFKKVLAKAFRLLGARSSSRAVLAGKLKNKGFDGKLIAKALDECERLNVLNDKDFAEFLIRSLRSRGYGERKIRNALAQKGIKKEVADDLLSSDLDGDDDETEKDRAEKTFSAKLKSLKNESDPRKKRDKLFRYMASRGFAAGIIYELLCSLK